MAVWNGIHRKCGLQGEPSDEWKSKVREHIALTAATIPDPKNGQHVSPRSANSDWMKSLTSLARRLME